MVSKKKEPEDSSEKSLQIPGLPERMPQALSVVLHAAQSTAGSSPPACVLGLVLQHLAAQKGHTTVELARELDVPAIWLEHLYRAGAARAGLSDVLAARIAGYLRLPVLAVQALAGRIGGSEDGCPYGTVLEEVRRAVDYARSDPDWAACFEPLVQRRDETGLFEMVRLYERRTCRRLVRPGLSLTEYRQAINCLRQND